MAEGRRRGRGEARLTQLEQTLRRTIKGEVLFDKASRGRYSTDASIYQIEPVGVVVPRDETDLALVMDVARDAKAYSLLSLALTPERLEPLLSRVVPGPVLRYELPGLMALKFVLPQALPGGVYASLRPGLHWQKAAIWLLLDIELDSDAQGQPRLRFPQDVELKP